MTREEAIQVLKMVKAYGLADEAKRIAIEALQANTEAHSYSISVCDSCKYIHVPFTHYPCSNCYDYDKYIEWKD